MEMRVKNMVIKYGFTITSNAEINILGKVETSISKKKSKNIDSILAHEFKKQCNISPNSTFFLFDIALFCECWGNETISK